jgi:hypothetical protein
MARSDEDDEVLAALGIALLEDKPQASISA